MLNKFKLYLVKAGRKDSTIELYINYLRRRFGDRPKINLDQIDKELLSLYEQGRTGSYLNRIVSIIRTYGHFTNKDYSKLTYFKVIAKNKAILSNEEIKLFLNLPCDKTRLYWIKRYNQWTMFFSIIAYSGMRCGEAAKLTKTDIDFARNAFLLEDTKTNSPRALPIASSLLQSLREYVKNLDGDLLFPSDKNHLVPVGRAAWWLHFQKRIKRLDIVKKNLTPYSLRHSLPTRWSREDISTFKIKNMMGHKTLKTTEGYIHLGIEDLEDGVERDSLNRENLPVQKRLLIEKGRLEKRGWQVVEYRKLPNGNYRLEITDNSIF